MFRKRVLTIIFPMLLIIMLFTNDVAFANQNSKPIIKGTGKETVVNEYLAIKGLQQKNYNDLQKKGFSKNDIDYLKQFDYSDVLRERSKLSDVQLRNLGYTVEQINMLRSFKGTEKEIIKLASKLRLYAEVSEHRYIEDDDRTKFWVYFDWTWSTPPSIGNTDILGFAWTKKLTLNSPRTFHTVSYYSTSTGRRSFSTDCPIKTVEIGRKAESKFDVMTKYSDGWAKTGWGQIDVDDYGKHQKLAMLIKYGHTTMRVEPLVSLGSGKDLNLTFTPSKYVKEMADRKVVSDLNYFTPSNTENSK